MFYKTALKATLVLTLVVSMMTADAQQDSSASKPLTPQQQSLVKVAALTATGNLEQLKIELNAALDAGVSVNEVKELLVQLYAYCGFPRSLNGINTFMQVVNERVAKGIKDKAGKEIIVANITPDKYEQGRTTLEALTKTPQPKPAPGFGEFVPRIDAFLKEHLFADVFASDVLSFQQRELITISALASMDGVESQLKSHIRIGLNTGITQQQLGHVAQLVDTHVGRTSANIVRKAIGMPPLPVAEQTMMVRIAEIEIVPQYLEEYKAILKDESAASVKLEPRVIAIFPMYVLENSTQVRIVEIYADKAAYQAHLLTPHFKHYKTITLKMVKSLKLVSMEAIDKEAMLSIFEKMN